MSVGVIMMTTLSRQRDDGFTLAEVCVALVLLALALAGVAQMIGLAQRATLAARLHSSSTVLAHQKIEQLRALTWSVDEDGQRQSDFSTDLTTEPWRGGGMGLRSSSAGALDVSTAGYVDYLNARGVWVGTGATPPPTATYVRRWTIRPLPEDPDDTLILQVLVTAVARHRSGPLPSRHGDEAVVTTMMTRKLR